MTTSCSHTWSVFSVGLKGSVACLRTPSLMQWTGWPQISVTPVRGTHEKMAVYEQIPETMENMIIY